jgi:hypothetical protein
MTNFTLKQKTEGAINNGKSRGTGNIGNTRHRTKTHKKTTTQNTNKMSNKLNEKIPNIIELKYPIKNYWNNT